MSIKTKLEYHKPHDYEIAEHGSIEFMAKAMQILGFYAEKVGIKKYHIEKHFESGDLIAMALCCEATPRKIEKLMKNYDKEIEFMRSHK